MRGEGTFPACSHIKDLTDQSIIRIHDELPEEAKKQGKHKAYSTPPVRLPKLSAKKKVIESLILIGLIFSIFSSTSYASTITIPPGYEQYGEYAEETYYGELGLLAIIVYAEAGNQDLKGKELVVDVVLNRLDDSRYPDTIYDIIFQKNQFSTATEKTIIWAGKNVTEDCYKAVMNEVEDRTDSDILYFRTGDYSKYGTPAYKYGDHYFSY